MFVVIHIVTKSISPIIVIDLVITILMVTLVKCIDFVWRTIWVINLMVICIILQVNDQIIKIFMLLSSLIYSICSTSGYFLVFFSFICKVFWFWKYIFNNKELFKKYFGAVKSAFLVNNFLFCWESTLLKLLRFPSRLLVIYIIVSII